MSAVKTRQKALDMLRAAGRQPDDRIDVAETALALAALDLPQVAFDPYRAHLAELAADLADLIPADAPLEHRVAGLRHVLCERHGYMGDSATYEDLQNANLFRVIDRRRGLPVALGILYLHAARSRGWDMVGLNFPGHFLIRLEVEGERVILDPFNGGEAREPHELRDLLKQTAGMDAELTPEHYAPVSNREVLLRLQNNLKLRHLREDQVDKAAAVIEHMLLFAPEQPSLWREAGLLNAHLGNLTSAIRAFETFLEQGKRFGASSQLLQQTAGLLQQLKTRLN